MMTFPKNHSKHFNTIVVGVGGMDDVVDIIPDAM
jgi:hypothetical protein